MNIESVDDLSHASHNTALIFGVETKIPANGAGILADLQLRRIYESRHILGPQVTLHKIPSDLHEIRNDDGSGRIAASAATVKHLCSNLASRAEDRVVHALYPGQQRLAADHPRAHRHLDPGFGVLSRANKANGTVAAVYGMNVGDSNLADTTGRNP